MGYKTYKVNMKDALSQRSGTDGFQPKFCVGKEFIKTQCVIGRTLRDDWRVEDIASRICTQLNIYAVMQKPCNLEITDGKRILNRKGVVSDNFELDGTKFVSYSSLSGLNNGTDIAKFNTKDKLAYLITSTSTWTSLPVSIIAKYFYDMVTVDLLVLNPDRHLSNFGTFWNEKRGYLLAMLFDFGAGLFEGDTVFDTLTDFKSCMRHSYITPYGEDPFDLFDILLDIASYRKYLYNLNLYKLSIARELFIHPVAYEYFTKILRRMRSVKL